MEDDFRYPAGSLSGRPFRETFALVGKPLPADTVTRLEETLDEILSWRELPSDSGWGQRPGEEADVPEAARKVWETDDVIGFLERLDEHYADGSDGEAVRKSVPRLRVGVQAEPRSPYVLLVAKADIDASTLPEDDSLYNRLELICNALRLAVNWILRDIDRWEPPGLDPFSLFSQRKPFAVVHGLVKLPRDEFSELREASMRLRHGGDLSADEEERLRRELRDHIGFRPTSASRYASHVAFAGNIGYQVGFLSGDLDHPKAILYSLRLEWESTSRSSDRLDADPSGWLPHPPLRGDSAGTIWSLLAMVSIKEWLHTLVEDTSELLQEIDDLRERFEDQRPNDLEALDLVTDVGHTASELRGTISWTVYKDVRRLRQIASEQEWGLEAGLLPPWWPEDREFEGQDTRLLKHFAGQILDLLDHERELTREAVDQAEFLGRQVEGRVSVNYASEMEEHNRQTTKLTYAVVGLTLVLVLFRVLPPAIAWIAGWLR